MSEQTVSRFEVKDLGIMSYGEALVEQERLHASVVAGEQPVILTVQHPNVLTMGKNADPRNLLFSKEYYLSQGVDFFETERGGQVTAHVPGQLVIYPILPILRLGLSTRSYVDILEQSVIDLLSDYGLAAHRDPEHPGVWLGHEKISAIGVRIKSRVAMHGLALNVNNSLDLFGKIVPCGIRFRSVTTMERSLEKTIDFDKVRSGLVEKLILLLSSRSKAH